MIDVIPSQSVAVPCHSGLRPFCGSGMNKNRIHANGDTFDGCTDDYGFAGIKGCAISKCCANIGDRAYGCVISTGLRLIPSKPDFFIPFLTPKPCV